MFRACFDASKFTQIVTIVVCIIVACIDSNATLNPYISREAYLKSQMEQPIA